ncbi:MAG: 3-oxoacyl-[acyl-carrier protein] reductase [Myxococcota bacterium]|jgi:3-oxoacyl-[acyl-carrier protein] reductase
MSDFLVDLGKRKSARNLVRTLGLPIPLPQELRRDSGPWRAQPLMDRDIVVAASELAQPLASALVRAGANPYVIGDLAPFAEHGEAWGRTARPAEVFDGRPHAVVVDASAVRTSGDLRMLYDVLHPRIREIATCGRLLVLGRPLAGLDPVAAAAQQALDGFVRSAAKEVGRKGSTANLIRVASGAEDRLAPALRWFLSPRSAFVSGQTIEVSATVARQGPTPEVRPLEGKIALVTGAARGIGKAIARSLAREGAHVLCLDLPNDDGPLSKVAAEVNGTPVLADVTSRDAIEAVLRALESRGASSLDVLVNNAGVTRDRTLAKMKADKWDLTLAVNLEAVIRLTTELPLADGGRVVNLSSIAGIAGNMGQTNYAASKAGVIGFTRALAPTLADRGVAVNAIAPGFIETRLTAAIPAATREGARRLSNLSQGGLPADIAEAATFFSSPGAAGLCGQILRVCGGSLVGA